MQAKMTSLMESSGGLSTEERKNLKREPNKAQTALESLQKNTAVHSLPSTMASKNSVGVDRIIIWTLKLNCKHKNHEELLKQLLLEDLQVDCALLLATGSYWFWDSQTYSPLSMSIILGMKFNTSLIGSPMRFSVKGVEL